MLDNVNFREGDGRERSRRGAEPSAPVTDREVPLGATAASDALHAWLDGEGPEPAVADARHVRLWTHLEAEMAERRAVAAPAGLTERIMDALPAVEPEVAKGWWSRPVEVTPAVAIAAAAGLVVLGAALNASLRDR